VIDTLWTIKDPRVLAIFKEAAKACEPLWVGCTAGGVEVLPRIAVVFEPGDVADYYFNADQVSVMSDITALIDGGNLSKTRTSAPIISGPFKTPRQIAPSDTLVFLRGHLEVWGPVVREFWT